MRFPGSNLDYGEINGNVIGSARSKDLTTWARGLSPTSTNRSEAPRRWRARRPLASRVVKSLVWNFDSRSFYMKLDDIFWAFSALADLKLFTTKLKLAIPVNDNQRKLLSRTLYIFKVLPLFLTTVNCH